MTHNYVRNGSTGLLAAREAGVRWWANEWNRGPKPFVWTQGRR